MLRRAEHGDHRGPGQRQGAFHQIIPGIPADQLGVTAAAASAATVPSIQARVFTPIRSVCNPPKHGMDLRAANAYASIVNVISLEKPALLRVKPGDRDNSYLYQKVLGTPGIAGKRMPFGGPLLSDAQIPPIHDWILAGAPTN